MVEPELLDDLPPNHPEAVKSRRDLIRLNALMKHRQFICGALAGVTQSQKTNHRVLQSTNTGATERIPASWKASPPEKSIELADLGSGDGLFMLSVARSISNFVPNVALTLVDRQAAVHPSTVEEFSLLGWEVDVVTADVFDWLASISKSHAITANLFLHHFEKAALAKMFSLIARKTTLFAACETRRSRFRYWSTFLLGLLGAGGVTMNDAPISVRAGFQGSELTALWPAGNWHCRESAAGIFSHVFTAKIRE